MSGGRNEGDARIEKCTPRSSSTLAIGLLLALVRLPSNWNAVRRLTRVLAHQYSQNRCNVPHDAANFIDAAWNRARNVQGTGQRASGNGCSVRLQAPGSEHRKWAQIAHLNGTGQRASGNGACACRRRATGIGKEGLSPHPQHSSTICLLVKCVYTLCVYS